MKLAIFVALLLVLQCAQSERCRRRKHRRYGGELIFCGSHTFQHYGDQYYRINYPPSGPVVDPASIPEVIIPPEIAVTTTTERPTTTEELAATDEPGTVSEPVIEFTADGRLLIGNSRQLINAPNRCAGGFDSEGGCVRPEDMFS